MQKGIFFILLVFFSVWLLGCTGDLRDDESPAAVELSGPAFVLFFTEN